MKHAAISTALAVLAIVLLSAPAVQAEDVVAVKAGRIITLSGKDLSPGVIVARDGRIVAIGAPDKIKIPWDAKVIDAGDRVVMPGMIEAHSSRGLDVPNEGMPTVPYVHVRDSINAAASYFEDSLRDGVVAMLIIPGNRTMVGGQGMVVRPHGITVEAMTVKDRAGMKISLLPSGRASRMSHMQKLRRYFTAFEDERAGRVAKRLAVVETAKAKGEKPEDEAPWDKKKQPLLDLVEGRVKAFIYCPTASDVFKAIELTERFGLETVLVLGADGFKAVDVIAKAKLSVVLDPRLVYRERDPETLKETEHHPARVFHDAGVPFALQTQTSALGASHLWFQAATAMRHGVPREAALRAVTLTPAKLLGVEDRFGTLEVGKDLNVVVLTGDRLDYRTWVDRVLFEGKVIYDRSKDHKLAEIAPKPEKKATEKKATEKQPDEDTTKAKPAKDRDAAGKPTPVKNKPKKKVLK